METFNTVILKSVAVAVRKLLVFGKVIAYKRSSHMKVRL